MDTSAWNKFPSTLWKVANRNKFWKKYSLVQYIYLLRMICQLAVYDQKNKLRAFYFWLFVFLCVIQVWYFQRLNFPNYLQGVLLAAYSENRDNGVSTSQWHEAFSKPRLGLQLGLCNHHFLALAFCMVVETSIIAWSQIRGLENAPGIVVLNQLVKCLRFIYNCAQPQSWVNFLLKKYQMNSRYIMRNSLQILCSTNLSSFYSSLIQRL